MPDSNPYPDTPGGGSQTPFQGRLLALDLGKKRVGLAVSDELHLTARPLPVLIRTSWKKLIHRVVNAVSEFDAQAIVVGLPLRLDGSEGDAATETRRLARKIRLSVSIPVYLQDERLTSLDAEAWLRNEGRDRLERQNLIDSVSAAIILNDFMARERSASDFPAS